jgi:hypothetical protein
MARSKMDVDNGKNVIVMKKEVPHVVVQSDVDKI